MPDYRPYNAAEVEAIRTRYLAEGAVVLAKEQGRDPRQIRCKAWSIGLRRQPQKSNATRHEWTPEEDGMIRAEWPLVQRRVLGHTAAGLAKKMGISHTLIRMRAAALGIRSTYLKTPDWTEEEVDLLDRYQHLCSKTASAKFRKHGFTRSHHAIDVRRHREGLLVHESTAAYSANGLAQLMGVSSVAICNWIKRGFLKANPRTAAVDPNHGGVGDRWVIRPKDVRQFIVTHVHHVDISRADKYWLVDLLAGDELKNGLMALRQDSAGLADSGFQEIAEIGA